SSWIWRASLTGSESQPVESAGGGGATTTGSSITAGGAESPPFIAKISTNSSATRPAPIAMGIVVLRDRGVRRAPVPPSRAPYTNEHCGQRTFAPSLLSGSLAWVAQEGHWMSMEGSVPPFGRQGRRTGSGGRRRAESVTAERTGERRRGTRTDARRKP